MWPWENLNVTWLNGSCFIGGVPKLRIIYKTTFFHTSFEGFQTLTQTILTQPEFNYLPYLCNYALLRTIYHKFFFIEYPTTMLLKFTIDLFGERERERIWYPQFQFTKPINCKKKKSRIENHYIFSGNAWQFRILIRKK